MTAWRQQGELWRLEPTGRPRGLIEFIGGSYLAASPQLSYRRCLEALAARGWRIHAWSYVPGFDHQAQANTAWRLFRQQRGETAFPLIRLGHSLGCKLHLLAPDGGRRCDGLVALRDTIDQSGRLIGVLQARASDASTLLELPGDHLTPASGGLRKQFLGEWADDPARQRSMERLAEQISAWSGTA